MKVLITGGSGFIGQNLIRALLQQGSKVVVLDLSPPPSDEAEFIKADLTYGELQTEMFKDIDAIIHLAGKNIFGRWNEKVKQDIYQSRILGTRNLVSFLSNLSRRPQVLVSASAVGFYGDRGEEELDEEVSPGHDFLAKVCVDWEAEARKAEQLGLRTVQIRTAPVLGRGGFLAKMLPAFKMGLGGRLGTGRQWFPWIHIGDVVNVYLFALRSSLSGPVSACSPGLVRNWEFVQVLAKLLKRPAIFPNPKWLLKIMFNDLAEAMVASQKVLPKKLVEAKFNFLFPDLKEALENLLS